MSASFRTLLPQGRNTYVVIVILFVLGTILSLYYLYYIPNNRQQLHQYGFRILGAISGNITERDSSIKTLYKNSLKGENWKREDHTINNTEILKRMRDSLPERVKPFYAGQVEKNELLDTGTHVSNNVVEYVIEQKKGALFRIQLSMHKLVGSILGHRHELFDSYLILKHDSARGKIVYQDANLGLDDRIEPDSILARKKGTTFSQIADVSIQGIRYKLFCFPFTLDKEHLVLGGLIKASDYQGQLNSIPPYLVYPLIILLLLILISLPFLKIYLMGPYEQIRFSDLTGLGLALFGGVTVITMIIIQLLLLARGYMEAGLGLRMLSTQIEQSMDKEVKSIRNQLRFWDTAFKNRVDGNQPQQDTSDTRNWMPVYSKEANYNIPLSPDTNQPYYNFERVNWVHINGIQHWRGQLSGARGVAMINVKNREYFTFFSQQYKDAETEDTGVTLMAPVNSWSAGDFVINFVERSQVDSQLLLNVATKMYSLLNTVLPPGYGFCVIDNKGKVYIHSEADRSLKENFLGETDDPAPLIGAINSRQDITLRYLNCYGKEHSVHIHPLSQRLVMPPVAGRSFFLLTFYDNSFMSPGNLRILAFSLVFTLFSSLLVVFWLLLNHGFSQRPLLYRDPLAARFTWIIPRGEDTRIYRNGSWFMLAYLAVLLSLGVFGGVFCDYITFALGLVSPFNILIVLYAYRIYTRSPGNISYRWKTGSYLLLMLVYSLFIYWRMGLGSNPGGDRFAYWSFQCILMLLVGALWLLPRKKDERTAGKQAQAELRHYSIFVLLLALCLGVLPMMVFTWFAHKREIAESVKKQELCMAVALEKRKSAFLSILKAFPSLRVADRRVMDYYSERCWQRGIYSVNVSCVEPITQGDGGPMQAAQPTECFYSRITGSVNMGYDKPSRYPMLNQPSDSSWYWERYYGWDVLHYRLAPASYPDKVKALRILMIQPRPYLFLSNKDNIILLALSVFLVLGGLYALIRNTVSRVFLLDFVRLFGTRAEECPEDVLQTNEEIKDMIQQQRQKGAVFRSKWNRLSGRQRIILLDLVSDGLANYRNVMEISALTGEGQPLCICDGVIIVKDPVFRQFILEQRQTPETVMLRREFRAQSLWEALRTPLLMVIVVAGGFIFLTQESVSRKLLILLTTLSGLLPLLPKLLGNFRASAPPPKAGEG